jgi:hypothetical protein
MPDLDHDLTQVEERLKHHKVQGPIKVRDQHKDGTAYARFNRKAAIAITNAVGSMTCAWIFCLLALCSLPAVLSGFHVFHNVFPDFIVRASVIALVAWIAQTFIQLVALSIIIVGQNIQAEASDKRAQAEYDDVVAMQHAQLDIHALEQEVRELLRCIHANPQTGPCPGHPELKIPASS